MWTKGLLHISKAVRLMELILRILLFILLEQTEWHFIDWQRILEKTVL